VTTQTTPHGHAAEQSIDCRPLVLVVHQSPTVRQALLVTLDLDGFEVLVAADCAEASALLAEMRPHIVVADLAARDEHADDFLGRLRSDVDTAHVQIIDFGNPARPRAAGHDARDDARRIATADSIVALLDLLRLMTDDPVSTPSTGRLA
jgi:CheY-like chemotaxis protein